MTILLSFCWLLIPQILLTGLLNLYTYDLIGQLIIYVCMCVCVRKKKKEKIYKLYDMFLFTVPEMLDFSFFYTAAAAFSDHSLTTVEKARYKGVLKNAPPPIHVCVHVISDFGKWASQNLSAPT